jgi:hypothetical protein
MTHPPENELRRTHAQEVAEGERFRFGENWRSFLRTLNEDRIAEAELGLEGRLLVTASLIPRAGACR